MIRNIGRRERNLDYETSLWHPLYLQFYFVINAVKKFFASLPTDKKLKIVDFGCGTKPYSKFALNHEYIGVDIDRANTEADILADAKNVPLPDEYADVVVSFFMLEHIDEPLLVLKEKNRILKPGGLMYMIVPLYWEEHEQPYDFYRFTRFSIELLLKKSGFKTIKINEINSYYSIMGLHLVRLLASRRFLNIFVPLFNIVFRLLDERLMCKLKAKKLNISNVMSFEVLGEKI